MALIYFLFTCIFTIYLVAEYSLPPFGISFGCPPNMLFHSFPSYHFPHLHLSRSFKSTSLLSIGIADFTSTYSLTHLPHSYGRILTFYNSHLYLSNHWYSSAHSHHCHSYRFFISISLFLHICFFIVFASSFLVLVSSSLLVSSFLFVLVSSYVFVSFFHSYLYWVAHWYL